jgi:adenylylsulfate kinase
MMPMQNNVHKGYTLWFTGMSGAGKSTLSSHLASLFREQEYRVEVLDGDEVRTHLTKGLGFTQEDRDINVDRIGYVARLLARNGVIVVTAAISPYAAARAAVRAAHEAEDVPFIEVYAEATVEALAERDVKGLYKRALAGEIPHFTGISDPYEPPTNPEIAVRTDRDTVDQSTDQILSYLRHRRLLA